MTQFIIYDFNKIFNFLIGFGSRIKKGCPSAPAGASL